MAGVVHPLMKDTDHPYGAIFTLVIENNMVTNMITHKTRFDILETLSQITRKLREADNGITNVVVILVGLLLRPRLDGVIPNTVQIGNCLLGYCVLSHFLCALPSTLPSEFQSRNLLRDHYSSPLRWQSEARPFSAPDLPAGAVLHGEPRWHYYIGHGQWFPGQSCRSSCQVQRMLFS